MPFVAFVDSVMFRNLVANPEPWLMCPGTFEAAFLFMVMSGDTDADLDAYAKWVN